MTYLKLKNRLRISLTRLETENIFGSAHSLNKNDPKVTCALKSLLKKAVTEREFAPTGSVWVEVLKNAMGGYDIFFSKSEPVAALNYTSVLVLEFSDLENAIKAAKAINFCGPSRLYKYFECYRLVVCYVSEKREMPPALEFADKVYKNLTETAKTMEHGTVLIKENAFEILSTL
ncbi:MAG: adaptor protein MecA [Clostridia bacterium]|nr:adaptor protein MecA [Clostridia bacterium]